LSLCAEEADNASDRRRTRQHHFTLTR
jgi:hypothetical protein